jgi:hypothetical protein
MPSTLNSSRERTGSADGWYSSLAKARASAWLAPSDRPSMRVRMPACASVPPSSDLATSPLRMNDCKYARRPRLA